MGRNNIVGSWGESITAKYLQQKRYKLVAMNYHSRFGEIDLIVSDSNYLVFVEVKLRKSDRFASAHEHVDLHKQQRIRSTAEVFLTEYNTELQPRFDVVEVVTGPDGPMHVVEIDHLMGAFEAGDLHRAF